MIVIDVGCARIGNDYSIERLIEWYHPHKLYGFDPNEPMGQARQVDGTTVLVNLATWGCAAWTYDGEIGFRADGLNSWITKDAEAPRVPCFDLARFIEKLPEGPVIAKIDAEGAEYDLLEHLIATGAVARLTRLLIEWHPTGQGKRRREIEKGLRIMDVPTEQWRF